VLTDDGSVTVDKSRGSHPSNELLATYTEGKLSVDERRSTERHLSNCAQCRAIVADSIAFLLSEGRLVDDGRGSFFPAWQRAGAAGIGLAAAAALVLTIANPEWLGRSSTRPDVQELVTAFATEPTRLTEGRLTGDFRYAAPPPVSRGGELTVPSPVTVSPETPNQGANMERARAALEQLRQQMRDVSLSPDVKLAAARLEAASADQRGAVGLWSVGVARLALRDFIGAVEALSKAAAGDPSNAELQSDLAAAYLARGRNGGGDDDMRMALVATNRALTLKPDLAEARFNRALALEALRMPEAKAAWQAIATTEKDPGWAKEAASHASSAPQE
jgi:tetratricopeptide (TPR) repeat protein